MIRTPDAWLVHVPGLRPEPFADYGQALAYSLRFGGRIAALYEDPETNAEAVAAAHATQPRKAD